MRSRRSDGLPQLSPVTVGVAEDGRVMISTREAAMKTKNLARDPHFAVKPFEPGIARRRFGQELQRDTFFWLQGFQLQGFNLRSVAR